MIDVQQMEMAHLGATKHLMQRVEDLYTTLQGLNTEICTLKNLTTR
jgi:hypothetical protein